MKPKSLADLVVAPANLKAKLQRMMERAHPPQSLLLIGAPGMGKRTLARAWVASWLCPQRTPEGHCGDCEVCLKWSEAGEHPDLRVLTPTPDQIKIDAVRETRQWMTYAPAVAPFRFVILEQAHRLNPAAANALLKMLEEPPERYHFVLTAPASDLLLQTILSRCRVVRLGHVPVEELTRYLMSQRGLSEDDARAVAELADGAVGNALRWTEPSSEPTDETESKRSKKAEPPTNELETLRTLLSLLDELSRAPLEEALRLAERFREICKALEGTEEERSARSALAMGLEYLILWYRDSLAVEGGTHLVRFQTHLEALRHLSQRFSSHDRFSDLQAITQARRAILGNANAQIVTETLFARLLSVR
ncbi:MAG: hypothetical protein SNJ72_01575 [Fimbriimonadales bacterium]